MGTNGNLDSDASGNIVDQKMYQSTIGSLLYVTASRPDVMFSVCMLKALVWFWIIDETLGLILMLSM